MVTKNISQYNFIELRAFSTKFDTENMLQLPITKHVQKPQPAGAAITLQHASYTPLSGAPQQSLQFGLPAKFAFYLWLTFSVRCRRRMWQWGEAGACRVDFQFSSCFKKWRSHFFRLFFLFIFYFLFFLLH